MLQNFHVVFYVTCRKVPYVRTLRYGSTHTDQRYVTVSYVTLCESGKQAQDRQ